MDVIMIGNKFGNEKINEYLERVGISLQVNNEDYMYRANIGYSKTYSKPDDLLLLKIKERAEKTFDSTVIIRYAPESGNNNYNIIELCYIATKTDLRKKLTRENLFELQKDIRNIINEYYGEKYVRKIKNIQISDLKLQDTNIQEVDYE